jgi:hypothetical protein
VGIGSNAYILYAGWLDELLLRGGSFRTRTSIAWLALAWALVGVLVTAWLFRRRGVAGRVLPHAPADVEERGAPA